MTALTPGNERLFYCDALDKAVRRAVYFPGRTATEGLHAVALLRPKGDL